jgi:hypothetical protein
MGKISFQVKVIALLALFAIGAATPGFGQITPELVEAAKKEARWFFMAPSP